MACFKYSVQNLGTRKAFGTYTKNSLMAEDVWYCPPGMIIQIDDVFGNSIVGEDVSYFNSYIQVTILGPCEGWDDVPVSSCLVQILQVDTTPNTDSSLIRGNGTATIVINEAIEDYEFSLDNIFFQSSNVFTGLGGIQKGSTIGAIAKYTAYTRKKIDVSCHASMAFTLPPPPPLLFATASILKHPTKVGAADGEIKVTILSGSGNYTVEFDHDEIVHNLDSGGTIQSMIKTGLVQGAYSVSVTDLASGANRVFNLILVDPVAVVIDRPGSFLLVPAMNSLRWVVEDLTQEQTLDNRLLINQFYPGYAKTEYFQPVTKSDFLSSQLYTDYKNLKCQLFSYVTKKLIKTFPEPVMLEENIGRTKDFEMRIEPDPLDVLRSRVYFTGGAPSIPVFMDTTFELLNSNEGYNGVYKPVAIETDPNLGYPFIVISKAWDEPPEVQQVFATGRFEATEDNFNVFEFFHDLSDVPEGCYYGVLTAFDNITQVVAKSEPIDLRIEHKKMTRMTYNHRDNDFGMAFVHGYTGILRIPALHGHKGTPGGAFSTSRNSDGTLVGLGGDMYRRFPLEIWGVPRYVHEKIATGIRCDFWTLNGVQHVTDEGYPTPTFIDKSLLSHAAITVEQVGWYNNFGKSVSKVGVAQGPVLLSSGTGGFVRVK